MLWLFPAAFTVTPFIQRGGFSSSFSSSGQLVEHKTFKINLELLLPGFKSHI